MALSKHDVNTRDFIFQGIRWWSVINLLTLIHRNSHSTSFGIVVGYQKIRSFQETQANLNGLFEKRNLMGQVSELFRRPRTMLKILSFSGDHKFFQKSRQIIPSMIRVANFLIYWPGRHNLELGIHFHQIDQAGWPSERISTEHFDRVHFV